MTDLKNSDRKSLLLLRGLPGSGKSTLAGILSFGGQVPVYSVDDFFTNENGVYHFNHLENHLAYKSCEMRTLEKMQQGEKLIIVDNTFTMEWEMKPYFDMAAKHDYDVFVTTVENRHNGKSIHDIPDQQIEKMKSKYKVEL